MLLIGSHFRDVKPLRPARRVDRRGFLAEAYIRRDDAAIDIHNEFAQAKLVPERRGAIDDVVVDIRWGSRVNCQDKRGVRDKFNSWSHASTAQSAQNNVLIRRVTAIGDAVIIHSWCRFSLQLINPLTRESGKIPLKSSNSRFWHITCMRSREL